MHLLSKASLIRLGSADAAAEKRFDVDALLGLADVCEIAVSPGGRWVAYTIEGNDEKKDRRTSAVWMAPASGGEAVRMTAPDSDASQPQWSPDGKYLAVLSDRRDETSQVWLLNRLGGDAEQLTDFPQGVNSYYWSPDSRRILLSVDDATPADLDEEELPNPRPWVIDRLQFKEDYFGYIDRHRTHLHLIDVATRETRQLTFGDYDDSEPAWSPDGKTVAFVSNRTEEPDRNRNTDLWIVDVDADQPEPGRLTENCSADTSPSWSPDGRRIAFTTTDPDVVSVYAIPHLAVIDIHSREITTCPSLRETQAISPGFSADGRRVLAITEDRGEQNLLSVDMHRGEIQTLVSGPDTVSEFTVGADGRVYVLASRPESANEVYRVSETGLEPLTAANARLFENMILGEVRPMSYTAPDGTPLEGFLTLPPDYREGRRYPGLLMIHGGPQGQFDHGFDHEAQILAAAGYVVVMPNPRGSWGYGQAFALAIYQDWGGIDCDDVIAAMDHAIGKGLVDADRTGVLGWSYGGLLTNHIITRTDRFKAAITGAGSTLLMSNYGHDQYQRWWEEELGLPWLEENRDKWDRISPFFRLDKVTTPTLIVGGESDWNAPIHNSEQLYIALKRQGVATELVVYPNQGHTFDVPSYNRDIYTRYLDWFAKHLL